MKYIIEVEDESEDRLYRAKGFETLVFNEAGLKKLEPVSEALQHGYDDGYQDGLNDSWKLAKKIILPMECHEVFTGEDLNDIFGMSGYKNVMSTFSASEALAKFQEYEEARKKAEAEIKVGDELVNNCGERYVITHIVSKDYVNVVDMRGSVFYINPERYKKTGRHFPEIEELLKQMKGE